MVRFIFSLVLQRIYKTLKTRLKPNLTFRYLEFQRKDYTYIFT